MSIRTMRAVLLTGLVAGVCQGVLSAQGPRFEISIARNVRAEPVTGRLIVVIAKNREPEPRYQISPSGAAMAAVDLEQAAPGAVTIIDGNALGYPASLSDVPAGKYWAQAIINVYQRVTRSDGHTIWVPFNDGRQAPFQVAEGNLYSTPVEVDIGFPKDNDEPRFIVDISYKNGWTYITKEGEWRNAKEPLTYPEDVAVWYHRRT